MSAEQDSAQGPAADTHSLLDATNDPASTDTDAVQNLITALRASLTSTQTLLTTQTTRLTHLGDVETELVKLKDEHAFVRAAKDAVEVQLKEETKKREVAEETVEALRGQVEAARRGVMTLQKQEKDRKRMSTLGGLGLGGVGEEEEILSDLANAGSAAAGAGAGTGVKDRSKRQSMLKAHRRVSSQSEPDAIYASPAPVTSPAPLSTPTMPQSAQPARPGLREFKLGANTSVTGPVTSPRPNSSQHEELPASPKVDPSIMSSAPSNSEETARLRTEVTSLQVQLAQAEEAREASENCLKALREFIAASPGGGGADSFENQLDLTSADLVGIRLPPLPTDRDPDEPPTPPVKDERKASAGGWGLGKLWKGQGQAAAPSPRSTAVEPSTPGMLSPGASVRSLPQRASSPNSLNAPLPELAQEPTEDKLNAVASTSTPLSSFVASWTKTVAPGTPAAATPGVPGAATAAEGRPSAARAFSGFWGRKKEGEDKGKDLPPAPEATDESLAQSGLEPSPHIDEQPIDADARPVSPALASAPIDFTQARTDNEEDAETGLATPKQSDRSSKELEPVDLNEGDDKRTVVDDKVESKEQA